MKLKVCTLNKTETEIDTSQDSLLSDVKKKVQEMMPHLDAARQLLIHQGKILNDSMRLSDYPNIKDGDRLVVMLPKVSKEYKHFFLFLRLQFHRLNKVFPHPNHQKQLLLSHPQLSVLKHLMFLHLHHHFLQHHQSPLHLLRMLQPVHHRKLIQHQLLRH